jgi:hypothetical protein
MRACDGQRGAVTLVGALFLIVVLALMAQLINRMTSSGIVATIAQDDAVAALFVAESGIEFASYRYANGTACTDLALIDATTAGRGSFDITSAGPFGTDCRITVEARVGSAGVTGPNMSLRTVSADLRPASSDGWAVGDGGAMLRWNGVAWSEVDAGTTENLHSVFCNSPDDCWAVGDSGTIVHWNGSDWSASPSGTSGTLFGVGCRAGLPGDCYANGSLAGNPLTANARHWNGTAWFDAAGGISSDYYTDVSCTSSDCYATTQGGSVRAASGAWNPAVFSGSGTLNGIDCTVTGQCWAVGDRRGNSYYFAFFDGNSWSARQQPAPVFARANLNDITCATRDACWAVGDALNSRYVLAHWDGSTWTEASFRHGRHREDLLGVDCAAPDDCWAVGKANRGWNLIRYDGVEWSYLGSSAPDPRSLNDVYVFPGTGSGVSLVHWQEIVNN